MYTMFEIKRAWGIEAYLSKLNSTNHNNSVVRRGHANRWYELGQWKVYDFHK